MLVACNIIEKLESKCDTPKIAYLIFNECVGAHLAYETFRPSFIDCFYSNPYHRMDGKHLIVENAPEPSTIIWENLNTSLTEKWSRRAMSTVIASLLIIFSFVLAFGTRIIQDTYTYSTGTSSAATCPAGFTQWSQSQQQGYITSHPNELSCYCNQFTRSTQRNDPYCHQYATASIGAQILIYFASAIVLVINSLIEYVMDYFAKFEKHLSEDTKELSLFKRLFFLKYLNSSIVFLLSSNANILSTSSIKVTTEFDASWYQSFGELTVICIHSFIYSYCSN